MSTPDPTLPSMGMPSLPAPCSQSATRTDDGSVVSVMLENCRALSLASDDTPAAESAVLNFEIPLVGSQAGLVRLEARGFIATVGVHSWAHAVIWVNGQRMTPVTNDGETSANFEAALYVDTTNQSALRVSVTLLTQRDLGISDSEAEITLDTLDFSALARKIREE